MASVQASASSPRDADAILRRIGDRLMARRSAIRTGQWIVVTGYLFLVAVPAFLPMPDAAAHLWNNVTLFAQFAFWDFWWPVVLVSLIFVGRGWCGLFCPEGSLTEAVSAHGRGLALPRWLTWQGWPFVAFAGTTIYGQMVSVTHYPKPALVLLGGSTGAAIMTGYLYGRNKRVWCRYLCPVTGVFGLLAKLAPLHFRVDLEAWTRWTKPRGTIPVRVDCAPLVSIPTMRGGSLCHMCGRCSGFRGAVTLARRSPNHEIVHVAAGEPRPWETALIVFGLLGIAAAALHWTSSALYASVRQSLAAWLLAQGLVWPLEPMLPWWILTNYPDHKDMLTPLDGAVLVGYVVACSLVVGGLVSLVLMAAARLLGAWSPARFHHLAQSLVPVAGCGVFLGLSAQTVTILRGEGLALDFVGVLRAALLAGASFWSLLLAWQITGVHTAAPLRRAASMLPLGLAVVVASASWAALFWRF